MVELNESSVCGWPRTVDVGQGPNLYKWLFAFISLCSIVFYLYIEMHVLDRCIFNVLEYNTHVLEYFEQVGISLSC